MIDTDKYEGHNMHPALLDVGDDYNNWDALQEMGFNDEARQLIADTPLLLEEVKRLRVWKTQWIQQLATTATFLEEVKDLQKKLDNLREYCHAEGYDIFNWEVKNIEVNE